MSDGKEAKILIIDEFHSAQGGFFKMPNGLYANYSCRNPELEKRLSKLGKAKIVEEKMLLNKCFICGGFLYQHTDLETANKYIYCPKCKEKHDKIKADMVEKVEN